MPNGNLGGGAGTQVSPFEVWDVADLNALRGRPTSAANPIFINFKADINLADDIGFRDNFDTIRFGSNTSGTNNWDFVHIDGEGHSLHNFKQNGTAVAASVGLFRFINGSIKNITVHNCDLRGNVGATRAVLIQNFHATAPIENVRVFGTMIDTIAGAGNNRAGIATQVNAAVFGTPIVFSNCVVGLRVSTATQFSGFCSRSLGNYQFNNCFSSCEITVTGTTTNGHVTGFVGVNSGTVNDTGTYIFNSCVADCKFICTNNWGSFPGVVSGFRTRASGTTQAGTASTFTNCISRCHFDGEPQAGVPLNMASFAPVGMFAGSISQSYAICTYDLKTSAANISGGAGVVIFDHENSGLPLSRFTDGVAMGLITAQMQSESFLTATRGWVFSPTGFRIDTAGIRWGGYPYIHNYNTPPFKDGVQLEGTIGYLDTGVGPLSVQFKNVVNIINGDKFAVRFQNSDGVVVLQAETALSANDSGSTIEMTINPSDLAALNPGVFLGTAFILRDSDIGQYIPRRFNYFLFDALLSIDNINPTAVTKPITAINNAIDFNYKIGADPQTLGIIDTDFKLGNYSALVTNRRLFELTPATTVSNAISSATLTLNVTAPIRVISVAHFVRVSTMSTGSTVNFTYTIDGVTQSTIGPITGGIGIADRFYEHRLSTPLRLNPGTRTIQFSSSINTIRLFFTTERPPAPSEFTLPGTGNIHRMRMEYIVDGIDSGVQTIYIDNNIPLGSHSVNASGNIVINDEDVVIKDVSSTEVLIVSPGLIDLGDITQSVSRNIAAFRFIGVGVDNAISTSNILGALPGDIVSIRMHEGAANLYEYTETLDEPITSYTHTIPANIFAGLDAIQEYSIVISIERGTFIDERVLTYTTVERPVLTTVSMSSTLVDMPITPPTPINALWRIANGIGCVVQGSAFIVNVLDTADKLLTSEDIDMNADTALFDFSSTFTDISSLNAGLYSVILSATISHDDFGSFVADATRNNAFTMAYSGVPGVSLIELNYPGRYVGAHIDITVTTNTFNIIAGDQLSYELRDGNHVIHSFTTANLTNNLLTHSYTIPAINFVNLRTGTYRVMVTSLREGVARQSKEVPYEAVKPPTLHFVNMNPNDIMLPIESPMDIDATLFVNGRGIDSIEGVFRLEDTPYEISINIST